MLLQLFFKYFIKKQSFRTEIIKNRLMLKSALVYIDKLYLVIILIKTFFQI